MPRFEGTALDIGVLIATRYVLGTRIVLGWYVARKTRGGSEDYFLGWRDIIRPIVRLSFQVLNMSGSTFVELPTAGYNDGIAVYNYEWCTERRAPIRAQAPDVGDLEVI